MLVIDIHAHLLPRTFPALPAGVPEDEWPTMEPLDDGRARMIIGGKEFRVFESAYWDVPERITYMNAQGIGLQILSPLPELLSYWHGAKTAEAMADHVNASLADTVSAEPRRFAAFGMLPLQDTARAIAVARRAAALGLRGILVGSNINGISIADARFDPIYEVLQTLDLAVFVHGYRPAGLERLVGSPLLGPIIGVPQDASAALASFMMTDIFAKFPGLKLGFAHGGGSFGAVLARMNHVWHEFAEMRSVLKIAPSDYVKKFFFDTVTFGPDYLAYLISAFGVDAFMAGTDGPTPIGQHDLETFVTSACRGDPVATEAILSGNARRFFQLDVLTEQQAAA